MGRRYWLLLLIHLPVDCCSCVGRPAAQVRSECPGGTRAAGGRGGGRRRRHGTKPGRKPVRHFSGDGPLPARPDHDRQPLAGRVPPGGQGHDDRHVQQRGDGDSRAGFGLCDPAQRHSCADQLGPGQALRPHAVHRCRHRGDGGGRRGGRADGRLVRPRSGRRGRRRRPPRSRRPAAARSRAGRQPDGSLRDADASS